MHARRGNRNACRFSASGTRRGGLATVYDFGLGAACGIASSAAPRQWGGAASRQAKAHDLRLGQANVQAQSSAEARQGVQQLLQISRRVAKQHDVVGVREVRDQQFAVIPQMRVQIRRRPPDARPDTPSKVQPNSVGLPGQPWQAPTREGRLMPTRPANFMAIWASAYRDWKAASMRPWTPYRRSAST